MTPGTVRVTVPPDADGSRLDQFLTTHVPGHTRSSLRRWIREGRVTVDGRSAAKPGLGLKRGMRVEVALPAPRDPRPAPQRIPLDVVHEDDHLVVVNKPAGLVVHPGHGHGDGTLVNALLGRGTPLAAAGGVDRPGIVHRLDRDTSGLMVVAKTDDAHRALARAFAGREVDKRYRALVWGHPDPPEGTVVRAIGRSRSDRTRMSVRAPRGREAVTHFRTVETMPGFSLLAVRIETGRTHQIRVHLQSLHHPVVGDGRYGGRQWKGVQDSRKRTALRSLDRLALHAARLAFRHPVTGAPLRFETRLPAELDELLRVLRDAP